MLQSWKPNPHERAILEGRSCGYCQTKTVKIEALVVCPSCRAAVCCDRVTGKPLGRVATPYLGYLRHLAHASFDRVWQSGLMSRPDAYAWLAGELGLPREFTHIAMLGEVTCQRVVTASDALLRRTAL